MDCAIHQEREVEFLWEKKKEEFILNGGGKLENGEM